MKTPGSSLLTRMKRFALVLLTCSSSFLRWYVPPYLSSLSRLTMILRTSLPTVAESRPYVPPVIMHIMYDVIQDVITMKSRNTLGYSGSWTCPLNCESTNQSPIRDQRRRACRRHHKWRSAIASPWYVKRALNGSFIGTVT